jgi:hypothetical protein
MKQVSKWWTLVPWLVPDCLVRWLPPWVAENVERAVYDGLTRAEWFRAQIDEYHAAQRSRPTAGEKEG